MAKGLVLSCRNFWHSESVRRWLLTIWIIAISLAFIYGYHENKQRSREGQDAHQGLCALKLDYKKREAITTQFLKENPNGIPGFSRAVLDTSLRNIRATLNSLKRLDCDGEEVNL